MDPDGYLRLNLTTAPVNATPSADVIHNWPTPVDGLTSTDVGNASGSGQATPTETFGFCDIPEYPLSIFVLTVYVGPLIAIVSCVENMLIFLTLIHKSKYYRSHFLYLLMLAFWDVCVAVTFLFMFPIDILRDTYRIVWLSDAWLTYLPGWDDSVDLPVLIYIAFTVGQLATTASTYFILCATFERFLIEANCKRAVELIRRHRPAVCALATTVAALMKFPAIAEIHVVPNGDCTGIREYIPQQTELAFNRHYMVYKFYVRTLCSDVIPFILILCFNLFIASKLRTLTRRAKLFRMHTRDKFEEQAALASRMLVVMVMTYLLSKAVNFVLLVWEFVDVDSLGNLSFFYLHSAQISNIMALMGCASRLPIYLTFNAEFRSVFQRDLRGYVHSLCPCPWLLQPLVDTGNAAGNGHTRRPSQRHTVAVVENGIADPLANAETQDTAAARPPVATRHSSKQGRLSSSDGSGSDIEADDTLLTDYPLSTASYVARQSQKQKQSCGGDIDTLILKSMVRVDPPDYDDAIRVDRGPVPVPDREDPDGDRVTTGNTDQHYQDQLITKL